MVEAMYGATKEADYCAEMEDNLTCALNAYLEKYKNSSQHFDMKKCMDMIGSLLSHLRDYARGDRKTTNAFFIEELVACGVARTIKELVDDEQFSAVKLEEIAKSIPKRLGKLLAEQGDTIHERLGCCVCANGIGRQQLIPACVVDIDVSPELQRLTEALKLGNLNKVFAE
ncbi:MAG: hypothetical protein ACTJLK_04070 [Anaplasma sp.]